MHLPSSRTVTVAGLLALVVGVLLGLLSLPSSASGSEDPSTARAVRRLTAGSPSAAEAALPGDFAQQLGYRPRVADGVLGRPDGSCSSPMRMPTSFDPLCRRHDLGYDLLRYAAARHAPLGPWARVALDRQLAAGLRSTCRGSAVSCRAAAELANAAVRANSRRQGDGAPLAETPVTVGAVVLGGAGGLGLLVGALALLGSVRSRALVAGRAWLPRLVRGLVALLPSAPVTVLVGVAAVASLVPAVLARPAWLQGLFTGLLASAGVLAGPRVTGLVGGVANVPRVRVAALAVGAAVLATGAGWLAGVGQPVLDAAQSPGPAGGWLLVVVVAGAVTAALVGSVTVLAALARRVRRRVLPPRPEASASLRREGLFAGSLVVVGLVLLLGNPFTTFAHAALTSPVGRGLFQAVGLPTAQHNVLSRPSRRGAVRVYVGVDEAPDATARAELAVRRLERTGGFDREALVLAFPTGSGWVDPVGVREVERRLGGDVATAAVQSTYLPSWAALMVARADNEDGARRLVAAVGDRLARMPASHRPRLYLTGESLGVLAATAVDPGSAGARLVCGATWVGPPGGDVPRLPGSRVLANPDDPVVFWEPSLAWRRPADYPGRVWVPVVSYLATSVDTVASLGAPVGHGHRYGPEQGRLPAACGRPHGTGFDLSARSLPR